MEGPAGSSLQLPELVVASPCGYEACWGHGVGQRVPQLCPCCQPHTPLAGTMDRFTRGAFLLWVYFVLQSTPRGRKHLPEQ